MSDHQRFSLDDSLNDSKRRPIDANWSPRKKAGVGVCAAIVAAAAIGGGAWAYMNTRTPGLPKNIDQAVAVMQSGKLDKMDPQRRAQYTEEARRLMWSLSPEEREKLFEDEDNRDALRAMREQTFDDMAYRRARGEEMDWSQFGPRERPEMTEEQRKRMEEMRERWENMTPEEREQERAKRMEEMRAEMVNRVNEQFGSGNSQSGALRGEMMGGGRGGRGGMGGGGRGPGGGGGGPRGGGGRGG